MMKILLSDKKDYMLINFFKAISKKNKPIVSENELFYLMIV